MVLLIGMNSVDQKVKLELRIKISKRRKAKITQSYETSSKYNCLQFYFNLSNTVNITFYDKTYRNVLFVMMCIICDAEFIFESKTMNIATESRT